MHGNEKSMGKIPLSDYENHMKALEHMLPDGKKFIRIDFERLISVSGGA